jgi:hypothetical protein
VEQRKGGRVVMEAEWMAIFGTGIFGRLGVELDNVGRLELGHFSSGLASDWTLQDVEPDAADS